MTVWRLDCEYLSDVLPASCLTCTIVGEKFGLLPNPWPYIPPSSSLSTGFSLLPLAFAHTPSRIRSYISA